ncbi:MAG: hypothetical protein AB7I59_06415 [Geminicoccaceae bacterium]
MWSSAVHAVMASALIMALGIPALGQTSGASGPGAAPEGLTPNPDQDSDIFNPRRPSREKEVIPYPSPPSILSDLLVRYRNSNLCPNDPSLDHAIEKFARSISRTSIYDTYIVEPEDEILTVPFKSETVSGELNCHMTCGFFADYLFDRTLNPSIREHIGLSRADQVPIRDLVIKRIESGNSRDDGALADALLKNGMAFAALCIDSLVTERASAALGTYREPRPHPAHKTSGSLYKDDIRNTISHLSMSDFDRQIFVALYTPDYQSELAIHLNTAIAVRMFANYLNAVRPEITDDIIVSALQHDVAQFGVLRGVMEPMLTALQQDFILNERVRPESRGLVDALARFQPALRQAERFLGRDNTIEAGLREDDISFSFLWDPAQVTHAIDEARSTRGSSHPYSPRDAPLGELLVLRTNFVLSALEGRTSQGTVDSTPGQFCRSCAEDKLKLRQSSLSQGGGQTASRTSDRKIAPPKIAEGKEGDAVTSEQDLSEHREESDSTLSCSLQCVEKAVIDVSDNFVANRVLEWTGVVAACSFGPVACEGAVLAAATSVVIEVPTKAVACTLSECSFKELDGPSTPRKDTEPKSKQKLIPADDGPVEPFPSTPDNACPRGCPRPGESTMNTGGTMP